MRRGLLGWAVVAGIVTVLIINVAIPGKEKQPQAPAELRNAVQPCRHQRRTVGGHRPQGWSPPVPNSMGCTQSEYTLNRWTNAHRSPKCAPNAQTLILCSAAGSTEPKGSDKSKGKDKPKKNPLAGCTLCHVDVEDEYVKSDHFHEKVACTECHGPSKGHVADENNEVKPDEMFARKDVDRLCSECHDCERKIPSGWSDLPLEKRKVCSECHVAHEFAKSAE